MDEALCADVLSGEKLSVGDRGCLWQSAQAARRQSRSGFSGWRFKALSATVSSSPSAKATLGNALCSYSQATESFASLCSYESSRTATRYTTCLGCKPHERAYQALSCEKPKYERIAIISIFSDKAPSRDLLTRHTYFCLVY